VCRVQTLEVRQRHSRVADDVQVAATPSTGPIWRIAWLTAQRGGVKRANAAKAPSTEIKAAGYGGGYTRVTDFIRALRQAEGQGAAANAFIPLAFELGEVYQLCQPGRRGRSGLQSHPGIHRGLGNTARPHPPA
jgi:hypothetical protein